MPPARIRSAVDADLPDLVRIYNHYVVHSHVTFDTHPFAVEARESWFRGFAPSGPHRLLVAEIDDEISGYASSGSFRAKPAYRTSVETTVYLAPERVQRGVGPALYAALLGELEAEGEVHRAYAGIALPNPASIALHTRLGFTLVGTFREVGFKFGKFWSVSWYEREIPALRHSSH
ncbi:MAG: N-acetyltransferase [Candidatus Latescibacterota bacterium]|nr:MAG: N-acetyltransferase [Candidatus Latescibacterota bacterium]